MTFSVADSALCCQTESSSVLVLFNLPETYGLCQPCSPTKRRNHRARRDCPCDPDVRFGRRLDCGAIVCPLDAVCGDRWSSHCCRLPLLSVGCSEPKRVPG